MAFGTRNRAETGEPQEFGFFSLPIRTDCPSKNPPKVAFFPFTFSHGSGDGEPRRLVSLTKIIGNFTNILPALSLCHIIQGQHLRIGAINSRVLEQTNNTGVTRWTSLLLEQQQHITLANSSCTPQKPKVQQELKSHPLPPQILRHILKQNR